MIHASTSADTGRTIEAMPTGLTAPRDYPDVKQTRALLAELGIQNQDQRLKPSTARIIEAGKDLTMMPGIHGVIDKTYFDLDEQQYEISYSIANGHRKTANLSIVASNPDTCIKKEQAKQAKPDISILLKNNEIARLELRIEERVDHQITIKLIGKTRKGYEGHGLSTSLAYLSNHIINDLIERFPELFEDKFILAEIQDTSGYKGSSTKWSSSIANELGYKLSGKNTFAKSFNH